MEEINRGRGLNNGPDAVLVRVLASITFFVLVFLFRINRISKQEEI